MINHEKENLLMRKISKSVHHQIKNGNFRIIKQDISSLKERMHRLKHLLKEQGEGACVIYCNEVYVDKVYQKISKYYPDQVVKVRSQLEQAKTDEQLFLSGERRILIATSTLRKNMAKRNIRLIIHFGLPLSFIDYCRQIAPGGLGATCVLLYCEEDFMENKAYLQMKRDTNDSHNYLAAFQELAWMYDYSQTDACLMQYISESR